MVATELRVEVEHRLLVVPDAAPHGAGLPRQREDGAGHASGVAGHVHQHGHHAQQDQRGQRLAPDRLRDPAAPALVRCRAATLGDLPGDDQADDRRRDVGPGPLRRRGGADADAGDQPPRPSERQAPPPRLALDSRPIAVEHDRQHRADDEQRDEGIQHRDPRVDQVQEIGRQQAGRGERADRCAARSGQAAEQTPGEQVDERDADDAGHRGRHAPAEGLVSEGSDPRADEPLAQRRMRAADEVGDPARRLRAVDVPARVLGVEDLVEHQADRPAQADQPQCAATDDQQREQRGVEPGPGGSRRIGHVAHARRGRYPRGSGPSARCAPSAPRPRSGSAGELANQGRLCVGLPVPRGRRSRAASCGALGRDFARSTGFRRASQSRPGAWIGRSPVRASSSWQESRSRSRGSARHSRYR